MKIIRMTILSLTAAVSLGAAGGSPETALERKIAQRHRILVSDTWGGGHRIVFDFNGRKGWIVEPAAAADGKPWVWTMQWMGAYLYRTGAPQLVKKGWHHVHLEAFDTRADDAGLKALADYQDYLTKELGFAKKTNLIGMSWGGFYSVRYASAYPDKVGRIYLDAPLLNVYTLPENRGKSPAVRIGSWAASRPDDSAADPRMAVNRAATLAAAKIPVLLLYGKDDLTVDPKRNCEPFLTAFKAAGGSAAVEARDAWGHHPHGLDADEVGTIVEFFEASANEGDRASFGPLSPSARPSERQYLWPDGKMPDEQPDQVAARWRDVNAPDFDRAANRRPYIDWYRPSGSNRTDLCVLTVSGGGFNMTCDAERLQPAIDRMVAAGITVADVTYRTPRPQGLPIHQTAWDDVQRAVRIVRSEAAKRGYSPEKIGATGISAGAKAVLLVATSSQTRAYEPVDAIDDVSAHLGFAVVQAPAYVLTDGACGANARGGDGADIGILPELRFDAKTCPMCFLHGGIDRISPLGSTKLFRRLREMGIPAELHVFADRWHGFHGDQNIAEKGEAYDHWWDRAMEFILPPEVGETFPSTVPEGLVLGEANGPLAVEAVERWESLRRQGVQCDLHVSGARGPATWRGRIRESLEHRKRLNPLRAASGEGGRDLRLMSYNVRMGCGHDDPFRLAKGSDGYLPKCAEVICAADPDVVGLQEVDRLTDRAGGVDQTSVLSGLTSLRGTFVPKVSQPGGDYGIALLSRTKPVAVESALLRGSLHTRVLEICEFDAYVVANTHFPLADWACTNAARTVCARLRAFAARKPVFLMGDFNSTPDSETLRLLREEFDVLTEVDSFTWPARKPDRTIDYIFVDKAHASQVRVCNRRVLAVPEATDHCALVVDLTLREK